MHPTTRKPQRAAALRWVGLALLIVVALAAGGRPAAAQATTMTLEQYSQLVREAFAAAQRNDEIGLREAAGTMVALRAVTAADGTELPVNNQWLQIALDQKAPDLRAIRERLGAQVEILTVARTSTPEDLARLQSILNAPPFAEQAPAPSSSGGSSGWSFWNWLFDAGGMLGNCLTILAGIAVIGLIIYIILAVRGGLRREVRRPVSSAVDAEERALNSGKAIQRADQVAIEGDFRKGVRYLYLSTLLWLEERNVLRYDRTLTNREVLEAVPVGSPLRQRLSPVVQTFDQVWYGFAEIDQAAFDSFRQQVTMLREGR